MNLAGLIIEAQYVAEDLIDQFWDDLYLPPESVFSCAVESPVTEATSTAKVAPEKEMTPHKSSGKFQKRCEVI